MGDRIYSNVFKIIWVLRFAHLSALNELSWSKFHTSMSIDQTIWVTKPFILISESNFVMICPEAGFIWQDSEMGIN